MSESTVTILGILIGWLLGSLNSGMKIHIESQQLRGKLLTKLIRVHRQLSTLIGVTETLKDLSENWKQYEPFRKKMVDKHFLEPNSVREDLKNAIDGIASIHPLLAVQLEDLYGMLLKNKEASLVAISNVNSKTYVQALSAYEVGLEICEKQLQKIMKSIALRHSVYTYLQLQRSVLKRPKTYKKNTDFINKLITEWKSDLVDQETEKTPEKK